MINVGFFLPKLVESNQFRDKIKLKSSITILGTRKTNSKYARKKVMWTGNYCVQVTYKKKDTCLQRPFMKLLIGETFLEVY